MNLFSGVVWRLFSLHVERKLDLKRVPDAMLQNLIDGATRLTENLTAWRGELVREQERRGEPSAGEDPMAPRPPFWDQNPRWVRDLCDRAKGKDSAS